ncbi:MAG: hypothetical protein ACMUIE_08595 [Thermoplasmatota archaeon]
MTRITRCRNCGGYVSEQWSRKEKCPSCGGDLEREDIDLGPAQITPRLLNIVGIMVVVISLVVIFILSASDGLDRSNSAVLIVLTIIGAIMFLFSLYFQYDLRRKAEKAHASSLSTRKEKKLRTSPGENRSPVRAGRIEASGMPPARASKIPVRKR